MNEAKFDALEQYGTSARFTDAAGKIKLNDDKATSLDLRQANLECGAVDHRE